MKWRIPFAFFVILGIGIPPASMAQAEVSRPLEIALMAKVDFFKWLEYSDDNKSLLVQDLGNLYGGGFRGTYSLNKRLSLYMDGDYFEGTVTYKGYIINQGNAQPYTQPNGYKGWDGSAKACYKFNISEKISIQPNVGLAARQWKRDLVSNSKFSSLLTYNELYFILSPQVGVDGKYSFNEKWSISVLAALSYPVISHEKLIFSDPAGLTAAFQQAAIQNPTLQTAAGYDWTKVSVENGKNINPLAELSVRFKNYSCFIRYQKYTLGRSSDGGTQGVTIHQPNSKNEILSVGLTYALIH